MKRLVATAMLAAVVGTTTVMADEKISVFVRTGMEADGFTDPSKERKDSVKDIMVKLKRSKVLAAAASEDEAVLIIEVLSRNTRREMNAHSILGGPQNKSRLELRLIVGQYVTEFGVDGVSSGVMTGYAKVAEKVVKQIEKWVQENHQRLLHRE